MGAKKQAKPAKTEAAPQAVVVTTGNTFSKRKLAVVVAVVVVLVAAVVAWLTLSKTADDKPVTAKDQNAAVLKDSASLERDRNYAGQADELQKYLDSNPPAEFAEKEIIRLAVAYQNAKDYQKAIDTYQLALDKYTDRPDTKYAATRGIGFTYMLRGDKDQNKDDWRKAKQYFEESEKLALADPEKVHVAGSDQNNLRYLKEMLGE